MSNFFEKIVRYEDRLNRGTGRRGKLQPIAIFKKSTGQEEPYDDRKLKELLNNPPRCTAQDLFLANEARMALNDRKSKYPYNWG
ncbi:MAG: hypothetical protein AAF244_02790 [Pseudomonadota bacterium]